MRWLNCCLHFGSAALQASSAALARAAQCRTAHGPGALLFLCGFAAELRCDEGVLPLNPAPLRLPDALLQELFLPLLREAGGRSSARAGAAAAADSPAAAAKAAVPAVVVDALD